MSFGAARILTPIDDRCANQAESRTPHRGVRWLARVGVAKGRETVTTDGVMRISRQTWPGEDDGGEYGLSRLVPPVKTSVR